MNEKILKDIESAITGMIGDLKPVSAEPAESKLTESVCFDYSVKDNTHFLALLTDALRNAKTFEIHCWNEETEWIELALKYGNLKEDDWKYGKIITGEVTAEFAEMLLAQPKPTDIEAANKMTPFFNVFLDDTFQSSHWGTEIYYGG